MSRILERASEIGVRKAFGASSAALVGQFVVENLVLTLVGGVARARRRRSRARGPDRSGLLPYAHFPLNLRVFLCGLAVALVFGVLSGAYPAWRMSRLHPVEALRGRPAMTRHLVKLVWNRKRSNGPRGRRDPRLSFLVLFAVMTVGLYYVDNYRQPLGFDYRDVSVARGDRAGARGEAGGGRRAARARWRP